jgi:hypothetical protein
MLPRFYQYHFCSKMLPFSIFLDYLVYLTFPHLLLVRLVVLMSLNHDSTPVHCIHEMMIWSTVGSTCSHINNIGGIPLLYQQVIDLIVCYPIWGSPGVLVYVFMKKVCGAKIQVFIKCRWPLSLESWYTVCFPTVPVYVSCLRVWKLTLHSPKILSSWSCWIRELP